MIVRHSGLLFDDFIGSAVLSEQYTIDDTDGTVALENSGPEKIDGVIGLTTGENTNDSVEIYTDNQIFTRTKRSSFFAKFRLASSENIEVELGFYCDASNFVILKVDTDTDFEWHFVANDGGSSHTQDYGQHIDTDWHTLEIRLLGTSGSAEMILDGDEVNKLTIVDANLPDEAFGIRAYINPTENLVQRFLIDYWGGIQPRDEKELIQQTDPGGADAITAMSIYNDLLHVGRGSDSGGAKQRYVQSRAIDGSWTDLGAPSATAGKVSALRNFSGYLYAGHDDEAVVWEWTTGSTWANVGTLTGATGCACLEHYQPSTASDTLVASTFGTPAKVMTWNGTSTWTDISDTGWPSGAAAIMIVAHDGKLFAYHGGDGKVYEYTDSGTTWTDRGTPGGTTLSTDQSKHIFSFKGDLYAFDPENDYLYKWGGSTTWTQVRLFTTTCSVKSVQSDGFFYYIDTGALALMRSEDGATWENFSTISGATTPKQIAIAEGAIFVGDDAGNVWAVR